MEDLNSVNLVGRVARDTELRYTNGGTATCTARIAVNRRKKTNDQWQDEASFIDIQIWGKTAEGLAPRLTTGTQIGVSGSLREDKWEQNGETKTRLVVVANHVQLFGKREVSNGF